MPNTCLALLSIKAQYCRYFPLLKPFVHYIPVIVHADGTSDLMDQIRWADEHPDTVDLIKKNAKHFAAQHLAPGSGRDCYSALLIERFSQFLMGQKVVLPEGLQAYDPAILAARAQLP